MTGIRFVPFPYNRVFISSSRRHLSCSQVTLEVSDQKVLQGLCEALPLHLQVFCPHLLPFFYRTMAPVSTSI